MKDVSLDKVVYECIFLFFQVKIMSGDEKSQNIINVLVLIWVCSCKYFQKLTRFAVLSMLFWQVRVIFYKGEHLKWTIVTDPFFVTSIIIIQVQVILLQLILHYVRYSLRLVNLLCKRQALVTSLAFMKRNLKITFQTSK